MKRKPGWRALLPRAIHTRPHLSLAIAFGALVGAIWPGTFGLTGRALIGWNAMVWPYLATIAWQVARARPQRVQELAEAQDEKAGLILAVLCLAAAIGITAIVAELSDVNDLPDRERMLRYLYTGVTVIGSWFLVGMLFCVHYAHLYYLAGPNARPFNFPERQEAPDYWDFLYFSFTIAVAVQTADVQVMNRSMRRLVLGQAVLTFFFNIIILGLSVNIGAAMINR